MICQYQAYRCQAASHEMKSEGLFGFRFVFLYPSKNQKLGTLHFIWIPFLFLSFIFLEMCFMFCASTLDAGSVKERYGGNKATLLRETWAFPHVFHFVFGRVILMRFGFCLVLYVFIWTASLFIIR